MDRGIITDAVIFFDNNVVVKEMLYPEFEAVLDHVVGIHDFQGKAVKAVFIQINERLHIISAVFFYISFDNKGYADKTWNIPLRHLAEHAGRGPNLGAGSIKLACRSQCSVCWHQQSLWDPNLKSGQKTLESLKLVVKRNRLGLVVTDEVDLPTVSGTEFNEEKAAKLSKKFQQELKKRLKAKVDEQRLRVATMKSEAIDHVDSLHARYQNKISELNAVIASFQQKIIDEEKKNQRLKLTLDTQAEQSHQDRAKYQQKMGNSHNLKQSDFLALQQKFEIELNTKIDQACAELKERLEMREVELFYRDEQLGRLHQDITKLRQAKQSLIAAGGGDRILKKLAESGITFVAYHPGIDHLTVPVRDMARYLESPLKYIANKCAVDLNLYQQWQAHYELPVCSAQLDDGTICAIPIRKVDKPSHFIAGESDCCSKHRASQGASVVIPVNFRESG